MKAVIFGAGGQVGRALARAAPEGVELVPLARADCDVRSPRQVELALAAAAPGIVFNAAAYTNVDRAESEPDDAAALNALAPGIIAEAARRNGARTVHISTDYVFDGEASRPYRPDDPTNPLNVYGATKLAGEAAVHEADPSAVTVRTSWVYSSSGTNFVTNMLALMRERERLEVVADQVGVPTSSRLLAAALWHLARSSESGLFHYCDSGSTSRHGLAVSIQEQARSLGLLDRAIPIEPLRTEQTNSAARRPLYSVMDAGDCWRVLGARPPEWPDNLRRALEEIRDHG